MYLPDRIVDQELLNSSCNIMNSVGDSHEARGWICTWSVSDAVTMSIGLRTTWSGTHCPCIE